MTERLPATIEHALWHPGPNYAADAVIVNDDGQVCLIIRGDNSRPALPGGFRDKGEPALEAAKREAHEEVGLELDDGEAVFSRPVDDPRNSSDRWIESSAYLFKAPPLAMLRAGDDAKAAAWHSLEALPDDLYGSHRTMIENAKDVLSLHRLLATCSEIPVDKGHMAYDYRLYDHPTGPIFVKRHMPSNFTEPQRDEHSRYYLQKESLVIDHLRRAGYVSVPTDQIFVGDSALVMEGFSSERGWLWGLPSDEQRADYIEQTLQALSALETAPALVLEEPILPSIISFYEEGWGAYTAESRQDIIHRLHEFQSRLHDQTAAVIPNLINDIDELATTMAPDTFTTNSHHDIRQNNIAWHPEYGVRIVDWSWYGPGTPKADTTSFLIDIAKTGYDVTPYLADYFDPAHAKLLIGFWLHHSLWPTRTNDDSVRLHQVASALTAYQLVRNVDPECAERS